MLLVGLNYKIYFQIKHKRLNYGYRTYVNIITLGNVKVIVQLSEWKAWVEERQNRVHMLISFTQQKSQDIAKVDGTGNKGFKQLLRLKK